LKKIQKTETKTIGANSRSFLIFLSWWYGKGFRT